MLGGVRVGGSWLGALVSAGRSSFCVRQCATAWVHGQDDSVPWPDGTGFDATPTCFGLMDQEESIARPRLRWYKLAGTVQGGRLHAHVQHGGGAGS